jgi:hypothetical protein
LATWGRRRRREKRRGIIGEGEWKEEKTEIRDDDAVVPACPDAAYRQRWIRRLFAL